MSSVLDRYRAAKAEQGETPVQASESTAPAPAGGSVLDRYRRQKASDRAAKVPQPTPSKPEPDSVGGEDRSLIMGLLGEGANLLQSAAGKATSNAGSLAKLLPSPVSNVMQAGDALGLGLSDKLTGVTETAATLGSGMVAEAAGGFGGLISSSEGGADAGVDTLNKIREDLTYLPRTDEGIAYLDKTAETLEPIANAMTEASEFTGDYAESKGASPLVSTFAYVLPQAVAEIIPAGIAAKAGRAAKTAKAARQSDRMQTIANKLEDPQVATNSPLGANFKLQPDGTAVENTVGKRLLKEDVKEANAALVTNSNKATRTQMEAMRKVWEDQVSGKKAYTPEESPQAIIGNNASRLVGDINKSRKAVWEEMTDLVKGEAGNAVIDVRGAGRAFYDGLAQNGMSIVRTPDGKRIELPPQMRGGAFEPTRKLLEQTLYMLEGRGGNSLKEVHKLKQRIDSLIDLRKMEQGGVDLKDAQALVTELRKALNEAMVTQVSEYGRLNGLYEKHRTALNAFKQYRPEGASWDTPRVSVKLAGPMSTPDTTTFNGLMLALQDGVAAMRDAGAPAPAVDIMALARFNGMLADTLDGAVKSPDKNISRAVRKSTTGIMLSAAVNNPFGVGNNTAALIQQLGDARATAAIRAKNHKVLAKVSEALRAP